MSLDPRTRSARLPGGIIFLVLLSLIALACARTLASWTLDYQWWREIGQVPTWFSMMLYSVGPAVAAGLIAFIVFWIAHARGMKSGGARLGDHPMYARIVTLILLVVSFIFGAAAVDSWTVVRFLGGRGMADSSAWHDPVFGHPLSFYLFELPFYSELLRIVLVLCVMAAIIYWLAGRAWELRERFPQSQQEFILELTNSSLAATFQSSFLRILVPYFCSRSRCITTSNATASCWWITASWWARIG